MHIITGGTGHVGSALANALLKKGEKITIVSRSSEHAKDWISRGAQFAVADVYDTDSLHNVFKTGKSVFLLNPPADPMTDTTMQERKTIASLVEALKYSGVEKVVVASTMGAQPGDNIGDLGVLYELEQSVARLSYSYSIIRSAYYMDNWTQGLPGMKETGELLSFYPADLKMAMVATKDIGELAAHVMMEKNTPEIKTIEAPERYSPNDVAEAFSKALDKRIAVKVIPKEQWQATYQMLGFSEEAAFSYSRMTEISLGAFESPKSIPDTIKGKTTLQEFIDDLIKK